MDFINKAKEAAEKLKKASSSAFDMDRLQQQQQHTHTHEGGGKETELDSSSSFTGGTSSSSLAEKYAALLQQYQTLENRFNEVSLSSAAGGAGADTHTHTHTPAEATLRAENEQLIGKMKDLLGRYRGLQKAAGELKTQKEEMEGEVARLRAGGGGGGGGGGDDSFFLEGGRH